MCGLYMASVKSASSHKRCCIPSNRVNPTTESTLTTATASALPLTSARIRPVRIAARRHRELLCAMQEIHDEELLWLDIDEVEHDATIIQDLPNTEESNAGTPVFTLPMPPVWTEENVVEENVEGDVDEDKDDIE